jgi:hypothetical protein
MNSKSKTRSVKVKQTVTWEDWVTGREARRILSRRLAGGSTRRESSSSDRRLRKLFNGKRGPSFSGRKTVRPPVPDRKESPDNAPLDMETVSIESSAIRSAGYSAKKKMLQIEFVDGNVYHYFGVRKAVFSALLNAPSAGAFLNAEIKGAYDFEMLDR